MQAPTLVLAAIVATAHPMAPTPIRLIAIEESGGVRLDVIGLSAQPYRARYTLEVIGQGPAGTNRTTQAGDTLLRPDVSATLLSVALGHGGAGRWTATLTVTPAHGEPYRQQRTSPAG